MRFYFWTDHRKIIGTVVSRDDYLVPKAGGKFDAEEYEAHPEKYRSQFAETVSSILLFVHVVHVTKSPITPNLYIKITIFKIMLQL